MTSTSVSGAVTVPGAFGTAWDLLPTRPWVPPHRRTVVIVPHPDDEVLGTAGLITHQVRAGVDVTVVAVTDGEAASPGGPLLARRRRREQRRALWCLGAGDAAVRLQLPDSGVARHESELVEQLVALMESDDFVVAPYQDDYHSDHEACGRAARRAASLVGCEMVQSLVWGPLRRPAPDTTLLALSLDRAQRASRLSALLQHRSQTNPPTGEPIVSGELLRRCFVPSEFFVDPT